MKLVTSQQQAINTSRSFLLPLFFSPDGKSGRLHYLGALVAAYALGYFVASSLESVLPALLAFPIVVLACLVVPTIRRVNDLGLSRPLALLLLVPIVNGLWLLVLLFAPGSLWREAKEGIQMLEGNSNSAPINEDR